MGERRPGLAAGEQDLTEIVVGETTLRMCQDMAPERLVVSPDARLAVGRDGSDGECADQRQRESSSCNRASARQQQRRDAQAKMAEGVVKRMVER